MPPRKRKLHTKRPVMTKQKYSRTDEETLAGGREFAGRHRASRR
jgi:hypothetical protein